MISWLPLFFPSQSCFWEAIAIIFSLQALRFVVASIYDNFLEVKLHRMITRNCSCFSLSMQSLDLGGDENEMKCMFTSLAFSFMTERVLMRSPKKVEKPNLNWSTSTRNCTCFSWIMWILDMVGKENLNQSTSTRV